MTMTGIGIMGENFVQECLSGPRAGAFRHRVLCDRHAHPYAGTAPAPDIHLMDIPLVPKAENR